MGASASRPREKSQPRRTGNKNINASNAYTNSLLRNGVQSYPTKNKNNNRRRKNNHYIPNAAAPGVGGMSTKEWNEIKKIIENKYRR